MARIRSVKQWSIRDYTGGLGAARDALGWGSALWPGIWFVWAPVFAPDARHDFLLLRQKKVSKEKATRGRRPLRGSPVLLAGRGGWLNSPSAQTTPADGSPPACVARPLPREVENRSPLKGQRLFFCLFRQCTAAVTISEVIPASAGMTERLISGGGFPGPLRGAEQRRLAGGSRLALSEPRSGEFSQTPGRPSSGRDWA